MRQVIDPQLKFGEQDISAIALDPKSRDDIPRLLRGLQCIYTTVELREEVFAILAEVLPSGLDGEGKVSAETGRPGMEQWKILVLSTLRLGLNADYDRILELACVFRTKATADSTQRRPLIPPEGDHRFR
jgi:transposase, IS5 family